MKYKYTGILQISEDSDSIHLEVDFEFYSDYQLTHLHVKSEAVKLVFQEVAYKDYTCIGSVGYQMYLNVGGD